MKNPLRKLLQRQPRPTTIRRSLLINMFVLIAFTSGVIVVATLIARKKALSDFSEVLLTQTSDRTEVVLEGLFSPVERGLAMAKRWGEQGVLDLSDPVGMNSLFIPLLEAYPQVSSMMVANQKGYEWMLLKTDTGWTNRVTRADEWGTQAKWYEWDHEGNAVSESWRETEYDPRVRPWFTQAIETTEDGELAWTDPYTFFTTKDPGITASTRWKSIESATLEHVVGFDVLLLDISRFTTSYEFGERGRAVVFGDDGRIIGLPARSGFEGTERIKSNVLKTGEELGLPVIQNALQLWAIDRPTRPVAFKSESEKWWGAFRPSHLSNKTFWIGVFVPSIEFTADADKRLAVVFLTAAISILLAFLIAARLARTYSRPLEKLALGTKRIRDLDLLFDPNVHTPIQEVNQLAEAHTQMVSALQSFSRYVPTEVVRELVHRGEVAEIGGEMESLTILFTDIRGFTSIAEEMNPQDLTIQMSEYFEGMIRVLHETGATVDKFIGDAILAFWGAPNPDADHALHGVEAVLACKEELGHFNSSWESRGLPRLPTCFGLDTGSVIVGNMGAPSRLSYTVLGDTVNLASRIEGLNRLYGTSALVSDTLQKKTRDSFEWRLVDRVGVKGRKRPVNVFEPLGKKGEVEAGLLQFTKSYEEAFSLYQSKLFKEAIRILNSLRDSHPGDASVERLIGICSDFTDSPPPEDWDGVARIKTK